MAQSLINLSKGNTSPVKTHIKELMIQHVIVSWLLTYPSEMCLQKDCEKRQKMYFFRMIRADVFTYTEGKSQV